MRSKLSTYSPFLFLVACGAFGPLACGGCDKSSETTADAGSAVAVDAAPATTASARRPMPTRFGGGPTGMILAAARSLELKDDQKAKLDKAEQSLRGDDASPRDEMKTLHGDLVAGVRAGKLDQAKVDADLEAIDKAAKDRQDKEAAALNDAYAALEPAQRTEVVAKIRERQTTQEQRMAARMAARGDAGGRGPMTGARRVERLTRGLDLDAEQQKKAQALAPKDAAPADARAEAKKRTDAVLAAFEKDGFDAKKLDLADPKRAKAAAQDEAKLIGGLLPILKPEQREKLAARLEKQHAGGPGPRARGPHGRRGLPHKLGPGEDPYDDPFDDDDDDDGPDAGRE